MTGALANLRCPGPNDDAILLPPDLRAEVEADVIAAYKAAKSDAQEKEEQRVTPV
jgi:hypothetical protein